MFPEALQSDAYRRLALEQADVGDNRHLPFPVSPLDHTATTSQSRFSLDAVERALPHYGSPHSKAFCRAEFSTDLEEQNAEIALGFAGADDRYRAFYVGQGTTDGVAYVVDNLFLNRRLHGGRNVILIDKSAHHAVIMNARKWEAEGLRCEIMPLNPETDVVDPSTVADYLRRFKDRVLLVMTTAVSNSTGAIADVAGIARAAHAQDTLCLIDAAQLAAHAPMNVAEWEVDFAVWSSHKAYAPLGRGVVVYRAGTLPGNPARWGGAVIKYVSPKAHAFIELEPGRHQAGTQLTLSDTAAAASLAMLMQVGMDTIEDHERPLTQLLVGGLMAIDGVRILGPTDLSRAPRVGVVAFTLEGLYHAKVSAALNYLFGIESRNGCYCNQPHMGDLLPMNEADWVDFIGKVESGNASNVPGSSRLSLGLGADRTHVERALHAVRHLRTRREEMDALFVVQRDGAVECTDSEFAALRRQHLQSLSPWDEALREWLGQRAGTRTQAC